MTIYLPKGSRIWHSKFSIGGRERLFGSLKTRSKAEAQEIERKTILPKVMQWREYLMRSPGDSSRLVNAVLIEIDRIEKNVGGREAKRAGQALYNFAIWFGPKKSIIEITTDTLDDYQIFRSTQTKEGPHKRKIKPPEWATMRMEFVYIRSLIRHAGLEPPEAPPIRAERHRTGRNFSEAEQADFFQHARRYPQHWRYWNFLCATGARPTEVLPNMPWGKKPNPKDKRKPNKPVLKSEVDLPNARVYIRTGKLKKGEVGIDRWIPLSPEMVALVREQLASTPDDYPYLFEYRQPSNHSHHFNNVLEDARIPKTDPLGRRLTAHSFRHGYATTQAQLLGNPMLVAATVGHKHVGTTEHYMHLANQAKAIPMSHLIPHCDNPPTPTEREQVMADLKNQIRNAQEMLGILQEQAAEAKSTPEKTEDDAAALSVISDALRKISG